MSQSLKSHHKFILAVILVIVSIAILVQTAVSYFLDSSKSRLLSYLNSAFGYTFDASQISFDFLRGIGIKNASLSPGGLKKPTVTIKDIFISIRVLPILIKRTLVIKTNVNEAKLWVNKEREGINLQIIFSDIYKKIEGEKFLKSGLFKKTLDISIRKTELIYPDNSHLDKDIRIILKKSEIKQGEQKFIFSSTIEFNYQLPLENPIIFRLFKNKVVQQRMKCYAQANIKGQDMVIGIISLNIGTSQILGTGVNKGFAKKNPYLEIRFMPSSILLGNINTLQENFDAQGHALVSVNLKGPVDDTKISINGRFDDCSLNYALAADEVYRIKNLDADFSYQDNQLKLEKASLQVNNLSLNADSVVSISPEPEVFLKASIPQAYLMQQSLPLKKLEAVLNAKITDTLKGDIDISALYLRGDTNMDMRASLKNIDFDYRNAAGKYFFAKTVELTKASPEKLQKLSFYDLKTKIQAGKDRIELRGLSLKGYDGTVNAEVKLESSHKASLRFTLSAVNLNVKPLMQDFNISDKLLSGEMQINIAFDNQKKEFIEGDCYIKNGTVDLDALAQIIKLPSLRNTDFEAIEMSFLVTKLSMGVEQIKLYSSDILLNGGWNTDGKIEGILSIDIASQVLNKSESFRRLLALTEINKPYINFSFLLGGLPRNTRIMWLKGEFKDKIREGLPARIKNSIENKLDELIDELANR